MRYVIGLLAAILVAVSAMAETPLTDPTEEARAQDLMREIRCVACENEPISQSSADIAEDMRIKVRELVGEGKSDAEVRSWFKQRYGEFVLFRPSGSGLSGVVLWVAPFLLLVFGGLIAWGVSRRGGGEGVSPIDPEDV